MKAKNLILLVQLILLLVVNVSAQETVVTQNPDPNPDYVTYEEYMKLHPFENTVYSEVLRNSTKKRNTGYLVVVESGIYNDISNSITIYQEDLAEENYNTYVVEYTGSSCEDLRDLIISYYQSENIIGAFLIGDLPVAWYEMEGSFDDENHWDPNLPGSCFFPIEHYFSDMDGIWIYSSNNPNYFDDHTGDVHPEISIGRIKADNIPLMIESESELINNYFQRNHSFRNEILYTNNALLYVDDDWVSNSPDYLNALETLYSNIELVTEINQTTADDYEENRLTDEYDFIQVHCHSNPDWHSFKENNGNNTTNFGSISLSSMNPTSKFYNLFACSTLRFTEENYMGGVYLLGNDYCLGTIGSTKSGSMREFENFYNPLTNTTIGEAFRQWWIECVDVYDENDWHYLHDRAWSYGLCIQGDPSLKVRYEPITVSGTISLESGVGSVENTVINFTNIDNGYEFSVSPNSSGYYSYDIPRDKIGHYNITYSLYGYRIERINDIDILYQATTLSDMELIEAVITAVVTENENINGFRTIQAGIDAVADGGQVVVLNGIYSGEGNTYLTWSGKNITLRSQSYDPELCTINGNILLLDNIGEDIITGFTFTNTSSAIFVGLEAEPLIRDNIFENNANAIHTYGYPSIENNIFRYNISNGQNWVILAQGPVKLVDNQFISNEFDTNGGIIFIDYTDFNSNESVNIIQNNEYINNESYYPVIWVETCYDLELSGNKFFDNYSSCSTVRFDDVIGTCTFSENLFKRDLNIYVDELIHIDDDISIEINNCSFVKIRNTGIVIGGLNNGISLQNCLFSEVDCQFFYSSVFCDYTLFWDNETLPLEYYNLGENIIEKNPLLNDNYQPTWGTSQNSKSPCIDTGNPDIDSNGLKWYDDVNECDADSSRRDIGAIPAIAHKNDAWKLPYYMIDGNLKWISFPSVDITEGNYTMGSMMEEITNIEENALERVDWIKLGTTEGYTFEWIDGNPGYWENESYLVTAPQGFKIQMNLYCFEEYVLEVSGPLANPDTEIPLLGEGQENWIGYFLDKSMNAKKAFAGVWDNLYKIKTQYWSMSRIEGTDIWISGYDATLEYGDMVVVYAYDDCTLVWNDGEQQNPKEKRSSENFDFTEEADYIPIYVAVDPEDDVEEIGVFVEGECKGAAVVQSDVVDINAYIVGDTGELDFVKYYGERAPRQTLSEYVKFNPQTGQNELGKIELTSNPNYYYVSFREEDKNQVPAKFSLSDNYPNPFNPTTTISFNLAAESNVTIDVYNIKGQKVKSLLNDQLPTGQHSVVWDGLDDNGKTVTSGIYFYKIVAGENTEMKKMLLLK